MLQRLSRRSGQVMATFAVLGFVVGIAAPTAGSATSPDFTKAYIQAGDVKPAFTGLGKPQLTPQNLSLLQLTACGQTGQTAATSAEAKDSSASISSPNPVLSDITQAFYVFASVADAKKAVNEIAQITDACKSVYTVNGHVVQGQGALPIGKVGEASASLGTEFQLTPSTAIAQTKSFFIAQGSVVTNVIVTSSKDLTKAPLKKWAATIGARLTKVASK